MTCFTLLRSAAAAAGFALAASAAHADTFSFGCFNIGSGTLAGCTSSSLSYSVEVAAGTDPALLTFYNNSTGGSTFVSEIYFDYSGTAFTVSNTAGAGTDFGTDAATPANIPSGNTYPGGAFVADVGIDANNPASTAGINNTESLQVTLAGISGAQLIAGLQDGSIRIGIHVQGIAGTDGQQTSAEFGAGLEPVPEPSTWALLLAGLGAFGFMARRRTRNA